MRGVLRWLIIVPLLAGACGHDTSTSPTTTTTPVTTTSAPVITTETFSGTLGVGATTFYPFAVTQSGTVTATLVSIGGDGVPSTVQVRLGLGTPDDTGCTPTTFQVVSTTAPVVSTTEAPGSYCANMTDVGNLFAAATFTVTIAHP